MRKNIHIQKAQFLFLQGKVKKSTTTTSLTRTKKQSPKKIITGVPLHVEPFYDHNKSMAMG